ncbi:MAG: hypothetical protein ACJZ1O_05900 [Candidatus Neomarinimicrobiota bacterium]|tara:strand:+ start:2970 stop:3446 length:477 start_codon:yes stop_codon:yes gene_type:complete
MKELIKDENFYETQQFRQLWVWTIILLVMFALITPIFFGVIGIILSIVLVSFSFGFIFLFWKMKLITTIKEDGINIIFVPFTNFIIPFSKIKYYKIREYRPIIEYGGWGIRFNKSGKAYTVCGTTGLQISLLNGKEILIGTQRPDPILESLNKKMMLQ